MSKDIEAIAESFRYYPCSRCGKLSLRILGILSNECLVTECTSCGSPPSIIVMRELLSKPKKKENDARGVG